MSYEKPPIGKNIQAMRIANNMTQDDLVAKLEVMGYSMSRSSLANIEAGRRNIKSDYLKALKTIFNVEYDEFFKE